MNHLSSKILALLLFSSVASASTEPVATEAPAVAAPESKPESKPETAVEPKVEKVDKVEKVEKAEPKASEAPVEIIPPFKPPEPIPPPQEPAPPELITPQFELTPIDAISGVSRNVVSVAPPIDLWDRIRRGYAMPNLTTDLVRDREHWYLKNPDAVFQMSERSRKYLFHIVEELELRNMPTELALLPFVESAFNPQAVSHAKAVGIWQFMPATGKYFALKQNAFRDDRRDVLASTRAALDYLQKLYSQFGDWHLALAAYNWGSGRVSRALSKNRGLRLAYTDLTSGMPMETRMYVPKLQAMKNIVFNPEAYRTKLPNIGNHPYFQTVTLNRDMDMQLIAHLAEVSLEDFKALNPSLIHPVIFSASTPQILLPWDNVEKFQSNMESYAGNKLASWTVWVAPSNLRTSDAAKMVGMNENDFRRINGIPSNMLIKAGSSLLIPRTTNVVQDVATQLADNGHLTLASEAGTRASGRNAHNARASRHNRAKNAKNAGSSGARSKQVASKSSSKKRATTRMAKR